MSIQNKHIYIKLTEYMFNKQKFDANFFIAKALIDKIGDFPDITVEEIAYAANTTPSTISKFCKQLGYSGFVALKNDVRTYQPSSIFDEYQQLGASSSMQHANQYFFSEFDNVRKTIFDCFDKEQMTRIAGYVHGGQKVTILSGVHSMVAANLCSELLVPFGKTVYEIRRDSDAMMIKKMIEESDVVFLISLTGSWLAKSFGKLNLTPEQLNKIVVITYKETDIKALENVSLASIPDIFSSTFVTIHGLFSFFILLSGYLAKTNGIHTEKADAPLSK